MLGKQVGCECDQAKAEIAYNIKKSVAGLGGLKNVAKRNVKADLLRHCSRYQTLFEIQAISFL